MSTPYSTLFQSFLGKFDSDIYPNITELEAEADMIILLNSAIVNFEYPKIDIYTKDDTTKLFSVDLTIWEIQILSWLMKVEWIDRSITSLNNIVQKLSSSDLRMTSQAAHLEALFELQEKTEKKVNTLKKSYSYRTNNEPDFSGLSGDD